MGSVGEGVREGLREGEEQFVIAEVRNGRARTKKQAQDSSLRSDKSKPRKCTDSSRSRTKGCAQAAQRSESLVVSSTFQINRAEVKRKRKILGSAQTI